MSHDNKASYVRKETNKDLTCFKSQQDKSNKALPCFTMHTLQAQEAELTNNLPRRVSRTSAAGQSGLFSVTRRS